MFEIIKLISIRKKEKKIFTKEDILKIYSLLIREFNVVCVEDIYFVKNGVERYFMGYHVNNFKIHIDYSRINKFDDIEKINYDIVFSIFHEIRHAKQMEYCKNNKDILAEIYNKCFDYILNLDGKMGIYYHLYHSCFPIEINADLVSYIYLIYICEYLKDNSYKKYYLDRFIERCRVSNDKNYNDLLEILLGINLINLAHEKLDTYDLTINGLIDSIKTGKRELNMLL